LKINFDRIKNFVTRSDKYIPHDYWKEYGKLYFTNFKYNNNFKKQETELLAELRKIKFQTVLEYGCGFGRITKLINENFKSRKYTAFDISVEQLNNAQKFCDCDNVDFIVSSIEDFEPYQKYDLVVGSEVLMHVKPKNIESIIKKIVGWSKKYILSIDATYASGELASHNFIHPYKKLYERYGVVNETKIIMSKATQSIFLLTLDQITV
jgi:2-polyprenyl-3-methyl-5-hydroxy-6-metoxy-1,4-benzoquinol methylase